VTADGAEAVIPDAVNLLPTGFCAVDHGRLDLRMTEITAS
jgi:hypothetical protein